jgi:hypothetical protein
LYYKLEGPEFARKMKIFDKEIYPPIEFRKAMNEENFKLIDGITGEIYKP